MKKFLIKRLSIIMTALLFAVGCAIMFVACNDDNGGNRKGDKCYVEEIYDVDGCLVVQYTTQYNNQPWIGTEVVGEDTYKSYFIKGDVLNIKAMVAGGDYYADENFALIINGEPVVMTETFGHFSDGEPDMEYYACTYTIISDITVDVKGVKEKTVQCTIEAETLEEMCKEFIVDPDLEMTAEEQKELFISQEYFLDGANVFVRFEDFTAFGLEKAEWEINELREHIVEHDSIVGDVGVVYGKSLYVYSKGYTVRCSNPFIICESIGVIAPDASCYFDDEANEYGFRIVLRPCMNYDNATDAMVYSDGTIKLITHKELSSNSDIRGSLQDKYVTKESAYRLEDDIDEVPQDNPIFSIQYGNQPVGDWLDIESFGEDGKLDVTVRLKKYSEPQWKALYDKMSIRIVDTVLKNGADYMISTSGIISLKLDRPYTYYDTSNIEPEVLERVGIPNNYMYGYEFYFDIVKMARDGGLVIQTDMTDPDYFAYDGLNIYLGDMLYTNDAGQAYVPSDFYYNNSVGLIKGGDMNRVIRKVLLLKGTYQTTGIAGIPDRYTRATVTDGNGNTFEIDIMSYPAGDSYGLLESIECEKGKEVAVVMSYYSIQTEDGEEWIYFYDFKALADLNVAEIRFHN